MHIGLQSQMGVNCPYFTHRTVYFEWSRTVIGLGHTVSLGAFDGGSPYRLSILRNANVACLCRLFMAMSHVEFKK